MIINWIQCPNQAGVCPASALERLECHDHQTTSFNKKKPSLVDKLGPQLLLKLEKVSKQDCDWQKSWTLLQLGFFTCSPPARWGLLDFKIALYASSFFFFFSSSPPRLLASSPPCQLLIAVGTAGPQLPAPNPSGRRWTWTYQQQSPDTSGQCWTSTGDLPRAVGTAGPQLPERLPNRMSEYLPSRMPYRMPNEKNARKNAR